MDPEVREYLDNMMAVVARHFEAVNTRLDRLDQRMDRLEERVDTLAAAVQDLGARVGRNESTLEAFREEVRERFLGIDERFRTLELRIEHFEVRVMNRLDAMQQQLDVLSGRTTRVEVRLEDVEKQILAVNIRLDGMAEDNRQRFRLLDERIAGIAA